MQSLSEKFVDLGRPHRTWAVAAIHGDLDRLMTLHDHLSTRFAVRDRLVYLGNYLGVQSTRNTDVIEEILAFRAALLAKSGMEASDIVYLRGSSEEAWQRLLRLQFSANPDLSMKKLQNSGVDAYLRMYNISVNDTKTIARAGSMAITRWTNQLRDIQRRSSGHEIFSSHMRRAAFTTPEDSTKSVLFVPAGFNGNFALEDQRETLWGDEENTFTLGNATGYGKVVRGFDPQHGGACTEGTAITLDSGCGTGGPLMCGCFDENGALCEIVAIGGQGALESFTDTEKMRALPQPRMEQQISPLPFQWEMPFEANV